MSKNSPVDYSEFAFELAKETLTDIDYYNDDPTGVDRGYLEESFNTPQTKRELKAAKDFMEYYSDDTIIDKQAFSMIFRLGVRIGAMYAS